MNQAVDVYKVLNKLQILLARQVLTSRRCCLIQMSDIQLEPILLDQHVLRYVHLLVDSVDKAEQVLLVPDVTAVNVHEELVAFAIQYPLEHALVPASAQLLGVLRVDFAILHHSHLIVLFLRHHFGRVYRHAADHWISLSESWRYTSGSAHHILLHDQSLLLFKKLLSVECLLLDG